MGGGMTGTLFCFGLGYSRPSPGPPARGARAGRSAAPPAGRRRRRPWRHGLAHVPVRSRPAAAARGAGRRDARADLDRAGRGRRPGARPARTRSARRSAGSAISGTTAVYGDRQGGWVDEATPIEPTPGPRRPPRPRRGGVAGVRPAGPHLPPRRHLRPRPQRLRQPQGRHGPADRQAGPGVLAHPCRGHRDRARGLDRPAAARGDLQCLRRRAGPAPGRGGLRRRADGRRRRRPSSPTRPPTSRRWRGPSTRTTAGSGTS